MKLTTLKTIAVLSSMLMATSACTKNNGSGAKVSSPAGSRSGNSNTTSNNGTAPKVTPASGTEGTQAGPGNAAQQPVPVSDASGGGSGGVQPPAGQPKPQPPTSPAATAGGGQVDPPNEENKPEGEVPSPVSQGNAVLELPAGEVGKPDAASNGSVSKLKISFSKELTEEERKILMSEAQQYTGISSDTLRQSEQSKLTKEDQASSDRNLVFANLISDINLGLSADGQKMRVLLKLRTSRPVMPSETELAGKSLAQRIELFQAAVKKVPVATVQFIGAIGESFELANEKNEKVRVQSTATKIYLKAFDINNQPIGGNGASIPSLLQCVDQATPSKPGNCKNHVLILQLAGAEARIVLRRSDFQLNVGDLTACQQGVCSEIYTMLKNNQDSTSATPRVIQKDLRTVEVMNGISKFTISMVSSHNQRMKVSGPLVNQAFLAKEDSFPVSLSNQLETYELKNEKNVAYLTDYNRAFNKLTMIENSGEGALKIKATMPGSLAGDSSENLDSFTMNIKKAQTSVKVP